MNDDDFIRRPGHAFYPRWQAREGREEIWRAAERLPWRIATTDPQELAARFEQTRPEPRDPASPDNGEQEAMAAAAGPAIECGFAVGPGLTWSWVVVEWACWAGRPAGWKSLHLNIVTRNKPCL